MNKIRYWNEIKALHNKANLLMEKQGILQKDIEIKFKLLSKKKCGTNIYSNILAQINKMKAKDRDLSKQITEALRKKDSLLSKSKKMEE